MVVMFIIFTIGFFDNFIGLLFLAWVMDITPKRNIGSSTGFLQFLGHIGTIFTIFLSGLIIDQFQSYKPFFWILCAISLIGIMSIWSIKEIKKKIT